MVYASVTDLDFEVSEVEVQSLPRRVLMVRPDFFQVEYVINPHMEGHLGSVDAEAASRQWGQIRQTYDALGFRVTEVEPAPGCPDMVFCANQTLPGLDRDRRRSVVLSSMASPHRQSEVAHFETYFRQSEYSVTPAPPACRFEGCGDAIWHHDARLLWCGYGFRTDRAAYTDVCSRFGVRGVLLELTYPELYHLDTCLSILDRNTALWVPSAFGQESAELIHQLVPTLIEVPRQEAVERLACNAHSPDGRHVLIQSGCRQTIERLRSRGFKVVELETSEFLKAGGSVFCMKQMHW